MLSRPPEGLNVRFLRYTPDSKFPASKLDGLIQDELRNRKQSRVAIMADDAEAFDAMRKYDLTWLDPRDNYHWSGWKRQRSVGAPAKRIVAGMYDHWFQWYMRTQRFRAFHTIVLINPYQDLSDEQVGGYLDGLFARLYGKTRQVIIVIKPGNHDAPKADQPRAKEVLRALLYGTRLSKVELLEQARLTFVPIPEETFQRALNGLGRQLGGSQTRHQLGSYDERLLEGMVPRAPPASEEGEPGHVDPLFEREKRSKSEVQVPDWMLANRALEDASDHGWITVPYEAGKLNEWLQALNNRGDARLIAIHERMERPSSEQWGTLLNPPRSNIRRILDGLANEGKLERRTWYREIGRPALAYALPGKVPFLDSRCGQCAFYAPPKRRCNLWWLANKTRPFFHESWKRGGTATDFEIHKMKFASKMGPHSSACVRFIDKKRDHLRDAIPDQCEICGEPVPKSDGKVATCRNCKTRYIRLTEGIRVMTAYEHEYNRLYLQITGGDARTALEAWRAKAKEDLQDRQKMLGLVDELDDILGEERVEYAPRIVKEWPAYSPTLQQSVDQLAKTTGIARRFSVAMAQSALNATRRILEFGRVYSGGAAQLIARQEKYVDFVSQAALTKLLPYEALIMKQYWAAYGLALRGVQQWFGPRKRSRYVTEFVQGLGGSAKGYSPLDAAINYLHQRRLNLAERINVEVGFAGTCDGFLHRKQYNSRKIGLLLDMIDPFKFADREELLLLVLDQGLTWRDFRIETDRRGSSFYYPQAVSLPKLDQLGSDADSRVMRYTGIDVSLIDGYRRFAGSLLDALLAHNLAKLEPFVFNPV